MQIRHSHKTFLILSKTLFVILLFISNTTYLLGQESLVMTSDVPSAWIQKMNVRRPMRFRDDTIMVKPRWFIPDHYHVQYAGNIGFMSIGAGYCVRNRYEPTLFYGLLNHTLGNSLATVHTVSLKNSFILTRKPIWGHLSPKAGVSVNWGYTNNTFNELPPHYPNKYYFQNKIHVAPFWGIEWQQALNNSHLKAMGLYIEFSTLDAYLLEFIRTRYVGFNDIWNMAVGISFYIH